MRLQKWITALMFLVLCGATAPSVSAQATVELKSYQIAEMNAEDLGRRVILYRDLLPGGVIAVQGRFVSNSPGSAVQQVEVSIDGRATWQKTPLLENGTFRFEFRPESDETYLIFVRAQNSGQTLNDVNDSRRQVFLSGRSVQDEVRDTLRTMIDAYRNKNFQQFMRHVDPSFLGDDYQLAWALRRDFAYLSNVELDFLIANMSVGRRGQVSVAFSYNRSVIASRDGKVYTDRGLSEMTFRPSTEGMRLYSMKQPLLFGLTYAGAVSSGALISGQNQSILVLNRYGNAALLPIDAAIRANDSGSVVNGTVTLGGSVPNLSAFYISSQTKTSGNSVTSFDGEIMADCSPLMIRIKPGMRYEELTQDIDQVMTITEPSNTGSLWFLASEGKTYSLKLPNGKYALIKPYNLSCSTTARATVKYRYQPSGAKIF